MCKNIKTAEHYSIREERCISGNERVSLSDAKEQNDQVDEWTKSEWMELEHNKVMKNVFFYIIALCNNGPKLHGRRRRLHNTACVLACLSVHSFTHVSICLCSVYVWTSCLVSADHTQHPKRDLSWLIKMKLCTLQRRAGPNWRQTYEFTAIMFQLLQTLTNWFAAGWLLELLTMTETNKDFTTSYIPSGRHLV